jgi:predicted ribosomally synthesized peptide with nif11-like leader
LKVKGDTSLQEKLKAAADFDAVLTIAKEAGFIIIDDDLKNAQFELSEAELQNDVGGECLSTAGTTLIVSCENTNWFGDKHICFPST